MERGRRIRLGSALSRKCSGTYRTVAEGEREPRASTEEVLDLPDVAEAMAAIKQAEDKSQLGLWSNELRRLCSGSHPRVRQEGISPESESVLLARLLKA